MLFPSVVSVFGDSIDSLSDLFNFVFMHGEGDGCGLVLAQVCMNDGDGVGSTAIDSPVRYTYVSFFIAYFFIWWIPYSFFLGLALIKGLDLYYT